MSKKKVTIEKLLSEQTAEKLEAVLRKGNIEQLKKQMEKLFTFKKIFNMHDDHLIELAECIVDLSQANDKVEFARAMEQYARGRISRYHRRKKKIIDENQWANVTKNIDEITQIDLAYKLWVYKSGFEYSKYQMYTMLCTITQYIQKHGKEGSK